MASVDERVVSMSFVNAKFEAGVAQTIATLAKLNDTLAKVGAVNGLADIEKAAQKITLQQPMSALDKLRVRLAGVGSGAAEGFGDIDRAGNKVTLEAPSTAIDKFRARLGSIGDNAAAGFSEIEKASNKVEFRGLSSAVDSVTAKFSGMTVAFSSALGTIVTTATLKGQEITKALTLGPITDGLEEYATNLNSIQTILANTKASGANLQDVNRALQQLNTYSDQTIYNFSQMAKNIGTFTAAGVDLKTATASIKGIANLAALSGSNSEQAATAMYQLSQAISAGRVSLQDWNSVVNAGMGGTVFQRALANTAVAMGKIDESAVKLTGSMKNVSINGQSFRESIMAKPGEQSWLSSDVLTNTLKQFTGDLSEAELAAQGFNAQQIKAIQETATTAKKAATEVKTLKGVFDVAKESMGSGWAATFQLIFGNFKEAKSTFTDLSNAIQGFISDSADARNKVLKDWRELGGRKELIEGLKAAFEALMSVIKPIKEAFRDIFPAKTGKDLFELTQRFREFMEGLRIGPETADLLRRSFRGLFALLSIGKTVVGGIIGVIFRLLGVVKDNSGGFLAITASIGDFLTAVDAAISKGKSLEGVFKALETTLEGPLRVLSALGRAIGSLFSGADPKAGEDLTASLDEVTKSLGPLGEILEEVLRVWELFFDALRDIASFFAPIVDDIREAFSHVGDAILEGLKEVDYNEIMTFIQTTFIGGLAFGIKKLLGGIGLDLTGGFVENLKAVTSTLTSTLNSIQKNINAQTMLLIAAALLALAGAATIFASIDSDKLAKAMTGVAVGLGQLTGAMALITKISKGGGFLALPLIAAGMVGLASAMVILAGAVKIMSTMDWDELAKGLGGVAGGLLAIAAASKLMGPSIILIGPGLVFVAGAMILLSGAMKVFGGMKWDEIAKGLVAIAGSLLAVGLAAKAMGPSLLLIGPGLILTSIGLTLLAGAVSTFGKMDLETIAKGIGAIAAALIIIGIAISAIPPTIALQAAGLVILGIALTSIATAIAILGNLGIGTIVKGLTALAGVLVIFAAGLTAMAGTLPGSVALLAAAAAFALLTPTLVVLGSLDWDTIIKGLAAIALTLGVLAAVGMVASSGLAALGAALLLLGGSILLASAGIYLLAKGFALLGDEGTKGVSVMVAAITAFIALIPKMVIDFLKGLVDILKGLVEIAPQIATQLTKLIGIFLNALVDLVPQAGVVIGKLLVEVVRIIDEHAGPLIEAGWRLLLNILKGISDNIGEVTTRVATIVGKFLESMVTEAPRLAASGAKALAAWLKGIADNLFRVLNQAANLIVKFLEGIAQNLPKVYAAGVKVIVNYLRAVADAVPKVIAAGVRIVLSVIEGVGKALPKLVEAAVDMVIRFVRAIGRQTPRIADAGAKAVIDFINGMARAIRNNDDALAEAAFNLGDAIIDGILKGLTLGASKVKDKIVGIAGDAVGGVKDFLGISSPSKVFMEIGENMLEGLAVGVTDQKGVVAGSLEQIGKDAVQAAENQLLKVPNILEGMVDLDPTITPVLDLTQLNKDVAKMGDLSNVVPITAAASFDQASAISAEKQEADTVAAEAPVSKVLSFEQNNYSPESLSDIEIYRQTKNQLAQAKQILEQA